MLTGALLALASLIAGDVAPGAAPAANAPAATAPAATAPAATAPAVIAPSNTPTMMDAPPPPPGEPVDVVEHLGEHLPLDLHFMDGFQNRVTLRELLKPGKPVLLTLVYFDCKLLCSTLLNGLIKGLNQSQLKLGEDYTAITVSFSPKDSPRESSLYQAGYMKRLVSASTAHTQDWVFLTGSPDNIKALTQSVGFLYRWDQPEQQYEHPAVSMVITPDGRISRYLYGVQPADRDLRLAMVEASDGKVGTTIDRVLLKCFRYDPASRKYHVYVLAFVRTGAAICGLTLAALLIYLWRLEIKKGTWRAPPAPKKGTVA
ncbi:MAG: SCO family protein [Deltaproteobacteria bacterium]|nr:SCO family protein [Deltaproteobacteria bacterium]